MAGSDSSSNQVSDFARQWRLAHRPGKPSRIMSDDELRAFIDASLPSQSFRRIAAACRDQFGPARAPSKSAVARYWEAVGRPALDKAGLIGPAPAVTPAARRRRQKRRRHPSAG